MTWTNPKTWVAGDALTASELNTYVRDNLNAIGTWQSWTPAWTAGTTNPTIGNGTITGRYLRYGKTVLARGHIAAGSTTNFGSGSYSFSLPVTAGTNISMYGVLWVNTGSGTPNFTTGLVEILTTDTGVCRPFCLANNGSNPADMNRVTDSTYTWNSSTIFAWSIEYETA